jgi:uncharacterized membrane protein
VKYLLTALVGLLLLLYPFVVYVGLNHFSPFYLALILLALLFVRLLAMRHKLTKMPWLLPATLMGGIVLFVTMLSDSYLGFKLYPLMMNFVMFSVFFYSYIKQPTVIETFARITEPDLSPQGVRYINRVTLVWCLFFILNGGISLYTALFTSLEIWTLYNGLLSYIFMALLMAIEFAIRVVVKKKHRQQENADKEVQQSE